MKKKIIFYIAILSSVIYLTSCSNRKEFTCVDIDTNQNVNTSEILGQKMTAEIYSDNIKFTFPDDTETGYDSFTVKIVDEETVKVPNNPDIFSISVNWHFRGRQKVSCISYCYSMSYILLFMFGLHCSLQYIVGIQGFVSFAHCKSNK